MERTPSESGRNEGGPDTDPHEPPVADDHFGIDLGPAGDRSASADPSDAAPAERVKATPRTLTERLATAAADRDDIAAADDEKRPT